MSITVSFKIDSAEAEKMLRKAGVFYKWFVPKFFRKGAERLAQKIREKAPVRTGRLRQSVTIRFGVESIDVGPTVEYAPFVEYGTKPHIIFPRFRRALRFTAGGETIFAKRVFHPGFPGRFFVRSAHEEFLDEAPRFAGELIEWYWRVSRR